MKKPQAPPDLWEQMDAAVGIEQRQHMDGISAAEYAKRHSVAQDTGRRRLEEALRQGKLIQGWRKDLRSWTKVYRPK